MIDFKKIGEAAIKEYLCRPVPAGCEAGPFPPGYEKWSDKRADQWIDGQARAMYFARCADQEDALEAAGRAAVAAMIPAAVEIRGRSMCANECPFEYDSGDEYYCSLGWKKDSCHPGHDCPAKGGKG